MLSSASTIGDVLSVGTYGAVLGTDQNLKIPLRYGSRNFNPSAEIKVTEGMATASKWLDLGGKLLNVVSLVDHFDKGRQNYKSKNYWKSAGYYGLAAVDFSLMFVETTDPFILVAIFGYNVVDAAAF